ncbi:hypothetical protein AK812_SmicGene22738 [Symbiodinium microadriaticum]|uniref:Uncharacterized protein n=1 Tax=Symbiodinium microadriaticum TaxID=2951 RepID=A0A1Q9DIZ4_SYMMI|nr:hypothetical protein AK812_SmicGene22738 [Symbiodinium microadriaticum]CAE7244117.1 unnamed protein product [Symbiodinium sp. KB8]CAE7877614.1 unnamed protein product [Symbiodinium microadriaticum]
MKQITTYCLKFPRTLTRPWKYNASVVEYFVELESTSKIKRSEIDKLHEETHEENAASSHLAIDVKSKAAFKDEGDEVPTENAESAKVKEEVKYYADALQGKISSITKMTTQLGAPYNPKPDEATAELAKELDEIHSKLNAAYGTLAGILTKLEMDRMDSAGLKSLKLDFCKLRESVAEPMLMKNVNQLRKSLKADPNVDENEEPEDSLEAALYALQKKPI